MDHAPCASALTFVSSVSDAACQSEYLKRHLVPAAQNGEAPGHMITAPMNEMNDAPQSYAAAASASADTCRAVTTQKSPGRRACDKCYTVKEKCVYPVGGFSCHRCTRLKKICTVKRPIRAAGRPRKARPIQSLAAQGAVPPSYTHAELCPFGVVPDGIGPEDEFMLRNFTDATNFGGLMVAPRIGVQMHREALITLVHHWNDISDGYFSMYGSFATALHIKLPGYREDKNLLRGTKALKTFVNRPLPTHDHDFIPWVWLGTSLLIHGHCILGGNNQPVRRYMLGHIASLGERGRKFANHPLIVSLIALDIFDSLLHRQVPLLNLPESFINPWDTELFLGLCSPLLRYLFELGTINHALARVAPYEELDAATELALRDLEFKAEKWQPNIPRDLLLELSAAESTHILTQHRVHKSLIQLYIHRLRYAFGTEDLAAKSMANSILSDLDLASSVTGKASSLVTLPFLVAAVEADLDLQRKRIIQSIPCYVDGIVTKSHELVESFLKAMWSKRDHSTSGFRWMDIMHELPPVALNRVGYVEKNCPPGKDLPHPQIFNLTSRARVAEAPAVRLQPSDDEPGGDSNSQNDAVV